MGVFVLIMAVIPLMGGSNINLLKAESPGPVVSKFVPKIKSTSRILYGIYLGLTVSQILLLRIAGMSFFDAATTTFGTVGTGGFAVRTSSLAEYSPAIQIIVTVFMILSGINFSMYFLLLSKKIKEAFSLEEVRWYLAIILAAVACIAVDIRSAYGTFGEALRHSFFQVASIITTTGFATTDFNLWPEFSKVILLLLMFMGACAGSTGGGLKVSRLLIISKANRRKLATTLHTTNVRKVQMDGRTLEEETIHGAYAMLSVYFFIMLGSVLLISLDGFSFGTNFSAVIASLGNVGPGFEVVGPAGNFSAVSALSKIVLMFDMLVGRLEFFPMLVLFMPAAWKR